jgi:hypothetical protein
MKLFTFTLPTRSIRKPQQLSLSFHKRKGSEHQKKKKSGKIKNLSIKGHSMHGINGGIRWALTW